ncbi:hypothetical protein V498_07174 [Pseudogymnoascus sp. VKM F-4517 (FW-2822)]|nr:hypothetical protein V498_07174 [Pseudogymnoascus sp. VKM F-4517 (FW-2822)]
MQLEDWLDDLCVRFIINLPEEDLSSVARICFQVEEAQWFYEDFIRPLDPSLPSMSLRSFCLRIFQHCPLLSAFSIDNHMRAFEEFLLYKTRVPVRGAIMLNQALDSVVLVKGWKKGANWSFPRGKINKDEDDLDCAVREVYEETGYDIKAAGLVPETDEVKYIDIPMREQHIRLYVFRDIPMDTHFEPRTRKEISKIEWYRLSDLPAFRKKNHQNGNDAEVAKNANKFYMVAPFLVPLKKWVQQQKKKDSERASNNHYLSQYADEGQTEEEGFRSAIEGFEMPLSNPHPASAPELNTMEGATAALHRLLKIQPATQGLQPNTGSAPQFPAGNTGDALLAILRGKPQGEAQQAPPSQPPRGPVDFAYNSAPTQRNPQNQYSMNPQESSAQPYNGASIGLDNRMQIGQQQNYNYVTQHHQLSNPISGGMRMGNPQVIGAVGHPTPNASQQHPAVQGNASYAPDPAYFSGSQFPGPQAQPQFGRHPQFLQHPQPLPPQVQHGVFTGGQSHGPILTSQFIQQASQQNMPQIPQQRPAQFSPPTQPNLPNAREPIISPPKPTPPQLTSHSLALLNAFRSQDVALPDNKASNGHPLPRYAQGHVTPTTQLQELPSEHPLQEQANANRPVASYEQRPPQQDFRSMPVQSPPTDVHKSALLSLFKTPTATTATMAKPIQAEPPQVPPMPTAMDTRPVVSPASVTRSRGPLPDGNLGPARPKADGRSEIQPRVPEQQQPFRPTAILTRPAQAGSKPSTPQPRQPSQAQQAQQPQQHRQPAAQGKGARKGGNTPKRQPDAEAPQQAPKPFAPQILKRPTQGLPMPPMPAELSGISPTRLSPPVLPAIDAQPKAQPTPPPGHKQALLSLFKKLPEPASSVPAEQRLSAERPFASGGEVAGAKQGGRRTSNQSPMSPTDKGFLLGYLDTIAKGGL